MGYTAQIVIKRNGKVVYSKAQTFDREPAAKTWMKKVEKQLSDPEALKAATTPTGTLADVIDKYVGESVKAIGKTKAQVLNSIKCYPIAAMDCAEITSKDVVALARQLSKNRQPQTVGNYISHLSSVFALAKPAWGYPLDAQAMTDAQKVCKSLGLISKSEQRDRRPTMDELDKLIPHFIERGERRKGVAPMHKITAFAIFSTRRQEEITKLRWEDFEPEHKRILVRAMKHPGQKVGNDVWCDLPDPAIKIIESMPKVADEIFPFTADAISAAFTRACFFLGINTEDMPDDDRLVFHDLRHEGISRLFEMGMDIPHAAAVSGHRSWSSLKRYTHLRQKGGQVRGLEVAPGGTAPESA